MVDIPVTLSKQLLRQPSFLPQVIQWQRGWALQINTQSFLAVCLCMYVCLFVGLFVCLFVCFVLISQMVSHLGRSTSPPSALSRSLSHIPMFHLMLRYSKLEDTFSLQIFLSHGCTSPHPPNFCSSLRIIGTQWTPKLHYKAAKAVMKNVSETSRGNRHDILQSTVCLFFFFFFFLFCPA